MIHKCTITRTYHRDGCGKGLRQEKGKLVREHVDPYAIFRPAFKTKQHRRAATKNHYDSPLNLSPLQRSNLLRSCVELVPAYASIRVCQPTIPVPRKPSKIIRYTLPETTMAQSVGRDALIAPKREALLRGTRGEAEPEGCVSRRDSSPRFDCVGVE